MNGHFIAAKPVINAPLRLPHGRSGPSPAAGRYDPDRTGGAKWMENERAIAVFSRRFKLSITINYKQ